MKKLLLFLVAGLFLAAQNNYAQGVFIPTGESQEDFLNAYKLVMYESYVDYRFSGSEFDTGLYPEYSESSIYWVRSGPNRGDFVMPRSVRGGYQSVTSVDYSNYDWKSAYHYAVQYKPHGNRIAIFKSGILRNNKTVSWPAIYFKNTFDSYLYGNIYYFVDESYLQESNLNGSTQLLIIPSFTLNGDDQKYYIDSVFNKCPALADRLNNFLESGGTIYAEGNAVYLIEKLGYLSPGAVDFTNMSEPDSTTNLHDIEFTNSDHPVAFTKGATGNYLYGAAVPEVIAGDAEIIAEIPGFSPVVFTLEGTAANGGRIICNTGLPAVGGSNELEKGSRQLQWTMNAIMSAFAKNLDVTRSIYNELPDSITAGKNAVSYDRLDTFEVRVKLRNLSGKTLSGIKLTESLRRNKIEGKWEPYFQVIGVTTSGVDWEDGGYYVRINDVSIPPKSEITIVYKLSTPDPEDAIHESVDKYISWRNYIYATVNTTQYSDSQGGHTFWKYRNYVDVMFSAFLAADTDLNWKNFLGLYYQPFKVFMIMENKERTNAGEVVYTQYIPKDVPFYWSDKSINIPVLKTPGGKYVNVLKGSNDQDNPEYDMDGDGKPDVWLDTASIYPKGYTIEEEEVYWLNPWEHLRSGDMFYYEDIDHDGKRAQDTDGDGIVDIEEPGDKIRVWKVTWKINRVVGYDYYDPYCSYEIWVDPPNLVNMAAGVGYVNDICDAKDGMFYPYSPDIDNPNLKDESWKHWMEADDGEEIIWKQLIFQKINNYEGFTFIDTLKENYKLKPTDFCLGTVPQPHREFIAVLSLGGEEIDMRNPTPKQSLYSKLEYKTIFNESRVTPIRSTYTYYAPLPNPLQFEYLSNNYTIKDIDSDEPLKYLPEWGKAKLEFDIDASTEYTYYWIRNAGHDVDYNDPSEAIEGVEELGDGVFGYMIYDIPKGMGGYKIDLPRKEDGAYDFDKIVTVDGKPFEKWLDNPNTGNEIEVWEDPYQYHIYIPQLLIPPAIDDDNHDGIDDWIDDRGDRFASSTGFLHDGFMLDNGEQWLDYPEEPFIDDIYGRVDSGWYHGADETYGDDYFENLGKTHFKINAIYEGFGKEGPVDISKGGWLVVEEIFGGSPWVIFSHVLNGFAQGVDYDLQTSANPSMCRFGSDTVYVKHIIQDKNEPHDFNSQFDPYYVSRGYGETTITTYVGGKDPCSLIEPAINMPAIIDPEHDYYEITLVPYADPENPDLADYPRDEEGTFIEIKIEIMNGTDDNWINTEIMPNLPAELGNSEIVMSYAAYPRPLVPAKVDPKTGEIIQGGDDIGSFRAGWRFNQPEHEVLVKMGNKLPLMQPSRRAYFIFLVKVDPELENGIYSIDFSLSTNRQHYTDDESKTASYEVPQAMFSVTNKKSSGEVIDYQKLVIGDGSLDEIQVKVSDYFKPHENAKVSFVDVNHADFDDIALNIPAAYDSNTKTETLNLSMFRDFPGTEVSKIYILEQGEVYSYDAGDEVDLTEEQKLFYTYNPENLNYVMSSSGNTIKSKGVSVTPSGPKVKIYKEVYSVNGMEVDDDTELYWEPDKPKDIGVMMEISNFGNDMNQKTIIEINPGEYFSAIEDKLPENCMMNGNIITADLGSMVPGQTKKMMMHFTETEKACEYLYDKGTVIPKIDISYKGHVAGVEEFFSYPDVTNLDFPAKDIALVSVTAVDELNVSYGTTTNLKIRLKNGMLPLENVWISLYALQDFEDTVFVGREMIESFEARESEEITMRYTIPENLTYLEFFAKADNDNEICEFCENNNTNNVLVSVQGPRWIQDVTVMPNPFGELTNIRYLLPRDMNSIDMYIYTVDGRLIDEIRNCPAQYGEQQVEWQTTKLDKGVFIVNIIGINQKGEKEKYFMKLIKE